MAHQQKEDHLSYNVVLAILQDTGRITGTMASFPTTNDALLRMSRSMNVFALSANRKV
jgi:hypothetical protein